MCVCIYLSFERDKERKRKNEGERDRDGEGGGTQLCVEYVHGFWREKNKKRTQKHPPSLNMAADENRCP